MDNEFLPGERVLLFDTAVSSLYNNRMCTIVRQLEHGRYEHTIDGYGTQTFYSYGCYLHRTSECSVGIEERDLMEVLACD